MTARLPLALLLTLVLAACGDDAPSGFPGAPGAGLGFDPSDPAAAQKALDASYESAFAVELDDAALERLLATHGRVLAAGGDVRAALAAAGRGNGAVEYGRALVKWKAMQEAVRRGPEGARRTLDEVDEQIARLEAQTEAASGDERTRLEQQLDLQRQTRSRFEKNAAMLKRLATPEVRALVARWGPRFEALEAAHDE